MKTKAIIGVGSNSGERLKNISNTVDILKSEKEFSEIKVSAIYETKAFGYEEQPDFYNCAISFLCEITLFELFDYLKKTEKNIGRKETFKWGPREIDLDLLFFGSTIFCNEKLTVPHPGFCERDFVIVPACEIEPDFIHPVLKIILSEIRIEGLKQNIISKVL
ncbi:MAG: 2-amino-4-hydroxy-6-hydroxymethyldihydropteridine diphosphokinase [Ignavibacteria bacterium]|nr:2-amino-4-hydroxy-6-hydroxymethyldihydropteridine diphosphokinase [Ignavibacteria bacterium]